MERVGSRPRLCDCDFRLSQCRQGRKSAVDHRSQSAADTTIDVVAQHTPTTSFHDTRRPHTSRRGVHVFLSSPAPQLPSLLHCSTSLRWLASSPSSDLSHPARSTLFPPCISSSSTRSDYQAKSPIRVRARLDSEALHHILRSYTEIPRCQHSTTTMCPPAPSGLLGGAAAIASAGPR